MNNQAPQKLDIDSTGVVGLHSVFPTIQGEGIFAGAPATFVRLGGCNLKCPMCDTEYTDGVQKVRPKYILDRVEELTAPNRIVVITGGEPFRQNLNPLVAMLIDNNFTVQIETNGSLAPTIEEMLLCSPHLKIVCSPKTGRIDPKLAPYVSAYKYVIHSDDVCVIDGLPNRALGLRCAKLARPLPNLTGKIPTMYVQPVDAKNDLENMQHLNATIRSAMTHGYTLCLQVHKIINVE